MRRRCRESATSETSLANQLFAALYDLLMVFSGMQSTQEQPLHLRSTPRTADFGCIRVIRVHVANHANPNP